MAADKKLVDLAQLIYEKTANGELNWEKVSNRQAFLTSFPKYSVMIGDGPLTPGLTLFNEQGEVIEDMPWVTVDAAGNKLLGDLYKMARRRALNAEQAVDDLLSILKSKGIEKH